MNVDSWLIDIVTVAPRVGADTHGMPTYGAQVLIPARVESKDRLSLAPQRAELKFEHAVCTTTPINPDDRLWLPGEDVTKPDVAHRPMKIDFAYTKQGDFTLYFCYLE